MRRYGLILIMMIGLSFFAGGVCSVYAEETLPGEGREVTAEENAENENKREEVPEGGVSGNAVSEGTVSGDTVSQNETEPEDVSSIEITDAFAEDEDGSVLIQAGISCAGSSFIRCVEASNLRAGIRKVLFQADGETEEKSLTVRFRTRANGTYVLYAYDTKGNSASLEIRVTDHHRGSFSSYSDEARSNAAEGGISPAAAGPRIYGGREDKTGDPLSTGQGYSVKSKDQKADEEPSFKDKYGQWSLLKEKDKKEDTRAWYEPEVESNEENAIDPDSGLQGLSDYGVDIFRSSMKRPLGSTAGSVNKTGAELPDLKFQRSDANIGSMKKSDPAIITGIISFIIFTVLAAGALLWFKGKFTTGKACPGKQKEPSVRSGGRTA